MLLRKRSPGSLPSGQWAAGASLHGALQAYHGEVEGAQSCGLQTSTCCLPAYVNIPPASRRAVPR
jgi:hypothetical protein